MHSTPCRTLICLESQNGLCTPRVQLTALNLKALQEFLKNCYNTGKSFKIFYIESVSFESGVFLRRMGKKVKIK
ncbi:hypothetical protein AMEX_G20311 [Astyanax mexicanus]|uniref:Uncharacterized protein n=1 Tax=Astyanax mexicanus TaxID=7994 RepID=A0A8T2L950_ASTMX|nr:hypothetical protein AMEX_G20311 [Astyanax mexicanus]